MKKYLIAVILIAIFAVFFHLVFSGALILPQSFRLGPLTIHYYGIIMAAAALAGCWLALARAKDFGIDGATAEDKLFWIIVGGFLGARLYHVFSSIGFYWHHPLNALEVWNGGLSIYGAVLGGILTLWIYQKFIAHNSSFLNSLDWLAPSVVLGQIIGRFGNFFNYEAFGYPTGLPWKMFVPPQFRPADFLTSAFFHPWFLFEAAGNAAVLYILLKIGRPKHPGTVVFLYLLLYNLLRFALEFLRIDSTFLGPLRLNAISSFVLVLIGAAGLRWAKTHGQIS